MKKFLATLKQGERGSSDVLAIALPLLGAFILGAVLLLGFAHSAWTGAEKARDSAGITSEQSAE